MKTLEDIKNEYANECGRDSWDDYFKWMELWHMPLSFAQPSHDIISKRYAIEVAKQALENASESATIEISDWKTVVNKESITDENNIPKI